MTQVTQDASTVVVTKETVPLWLAVALTVLISMPFGLWLGEFNFTLWCSFIVWAEYFALGAKPAALKLILPSFSYAAMLTAVILWVTPWFGFLPSLVAEGDTAASLVLFVGVAFMVYSMRWSKTFQDGSLPFFNGVSMALAIYYTGSFPEMGPPAAAALVAGVWTILMGAFGGALAVLNVWLTFPKQSNPDRSAASPN